MRYIRAYNIAMRSQRRKTVRRIYASTGIRLSADAIAHLMRLARDLATLAFPKEFSA